MTGSDGLKEMRKEKVGLNSDIKHLKSKSQQVEALGPSRALVSYHFETVRGEPSEAKELDLWR